MPISTSSFGDERDNRYSEYEQEENFERDTMDFPSLTPESAEALLKRLGGGVAEKLRVLEGIGWRATIEPNSSAGVTTMLGFFQLFAEPYVMTQGGPLKSTTTIVLLMYEEGFRWWRMGMAAAIAFVLLVIMLIGTLIQIRVQRARSA